MLGAMGVVQSSRHREVLGWCTCSRLALVDSLSLREDAIVGFSMGADWSVPMACGTLWLQAALARTTAAGRGVVRSLCR
jgi:hypothetical protein